MLDSKNMNILQVSGKEAAVVRKPIKSVCVFCGSKFGNLPGIQEAVKELALEFVARDIRLVYGGGNIGIMGLLASTIHENGGKVTGIIPEAMIPHSVSLLGDNIAVPDMHTRKQLMNEHCDAFITLPGGLGTLEETVETITWSQLKIHEKPIVIFNYLGFYDHFKSWVNHASKTGFIYDSDTSIPVFIDQAKDIFDGLLNYPELEKQIPFQWPKKYI